MDRAFFEPMRKCKSPPEPNDILVRTPRVTIYSRLVEGRFPRWRDVFPQRQDAQKIELPIGPVYAAVRQAAIVTNDESRGIDFKFADGTADVGRPGRRGRPSARRIADRLHRPGRFDHA